MSTNKLAIIIPTRLDSNRLWGKALLPLAGRPTLELLLDRTRSTLWTQIMAISDHPASAPIVDFAHHHGIPHVVGFHEDVQKRVLVAADRVDADVIVRATHDNPMLDTRAIRAGLDAFFATDEPCVDNLHVPNNPTDPWGYFVDIASVDAIRQQRLSGEDREHVTLGIKRADRCTPFSVLSGDQSDVNWSIDEPDDYLHMHRLFTECGPNATAEEAVRWEREQRFELDAAMGHA